MGVELARRLGALRRLSDSAWRIALLTFLGTGLGVLLVANLTLGDKRIDQNVPSLYTVSDPQFVRTMGVMLGPALLPGNRVQALVNGDEIFADMLQAIRGAQKSITFEMYIYWRGTIGDEFTAALAERARAGVKVHVLIDALGSQKIDEAVIERMKQAGARVELYNPVRWHTLARMNNRTHRKIMVVDGRIGYTGGVGIGDEWRGDARNPAEWRDTHFRLEGPAVAQMQAAFMENWIEVTGEVLHGAEYFPELAPAGASGAQFFVSSPGGGGESAQFLYLMSIAAAGRSIQLSAAYFVPDNNEVHQLVAARARGPCSAHRAGCRHRLRGRAPRLPLHVGRAPARSRRDLRIPADILSREGDDGGRPVGQRRLDQLRHPLVQHQRRGQPQHLRPRLRAGPGEDFRRRSRALASRHARGMGTPAAPRAALGARERAAQLAAVRADLGLNAQPACRRSSVRARIRLSSGPRRPQERTEP